MKLLESVLPTQRARSVYFDWPNDQIPDGGMSDGQNVEPRGDSPDFASIGKSPGWAKYSTTAVPGTGPVMDIKDFIKADGTRKFMAVTTTRASAYNVGTNVFDDVTGGLNLLTASATAPIFTATLNDLFIVGDENDAPRKYTGAAWGLLGGSPPTFLGFDVYEGHLLGWSTTAVKYRTQWSQLNNPELWTPAVGQEQGTLDLRDHNLLGIMAGAKLGRHFLFYKEQMGGVYAMTYVGLPDVMVQQLMIPSFGVFSPRGILSLGNIHYVIGSDEKLYAVTLGGKEEIAQGIRRRFFSSINWDKRRAAYVAVDPLRSLILFCIPTGGSATPDRAYLYNYRTGGTGECEWPFAFAGTIRDPEVTTINDLTGTIDALLGTIDELSTLGKDRLFMGGTAASTYAYKRQGENKDGTAMHAWVSGKWVGSGNGRYMRVRGVEVDTPKRFGMHSEIGTLDDLSGSTTAVALGNVPMGGRVDANISGRWVAPSFGSNGLDYFWEITGYRLDAYPLGRR